MENSTILFWYLVVWPIYVIGIHSFSHFKKLRQIVVLISHLIPTIVAALMSYIFLIKKGATVSQYVAGSKTGMDLWHLWASLWPCLLMFTAFSAFTNFIWIIIACTKKPNRKWIFIAVAAFIMSVFAFFTVGANFPDA